MTAVRCPITVALRRIIGVFLLHRSIKEHTIKEIEVFAVGWVEYRR